jgi:hypothetical protein
MQLLEQKLKEEITARQSDKSKIMQRDNKIAVLTNRISELEGEDGVNKAGVKPKK